MRLRTAAALAVLACGPVARAAAPDTTVAPLPDGAWRVGWLSHDAPSVWTAGRAHQVSVVVRNLGDVPWPDRRHASPRAEGDHAVRLGCRWRCAADQRQPAADDATGECRTVRADLPAPLAPGESVQLTLAVPAPRTPGSCQLTFDLVQENVAWFSTRGARTLALPAEVAPPPAGAAPPLWIHVARVAVLALAGLALLTLAGLAPARVLRSRRSATWLPLAVPAIGLATLSALGHALSHLPRGTDWSAGPMLGVLGLLGGLAWRGRARRRSRRLHVGAWLAAAVGLALGLWPLVDVGELTAVGHNIDAVVYVAGAERLQRMGMERAPEAAVEDPIASLGRGLVATGLRQGDQFFLATFASLTSLRPHHLFSIVMAFFGALLPLGVFAFARRALHARPAAATLAALFAAVHPLAHYVRLSDYFSQAAGMACFPFAALALVEAPRDRSWRGWALAGLLVGALVTLYPIYLAYLAPLLLFALLVPGSRGLRARLSGFARLLAAGLAALLLFPYGWRLVVQALPYTLFVAGGGLNDLYEQGAMRAFAHPGVAFGLVDPLSLEYAATPPTHPVVAVLLIVALALAGFGVAAARPRARLLALVLVATLGAGAAHQRFALGFPYGYYKVLALFAPWLSALVALGLVAAWRRARAWPTPRGALARLAVGVAGVALSAVFARQCWVTTRELVGPRLVADHAQLELEQARALLPPDEPLLWLDTRWPGRAWDLYLLEHPGNYDRDAPPGYAAAIENESPRLIRHALLARGALPLVPHAGEPWWDPASHEVLWSNGRFRLLRRRDGAVAELRFVHPLSRLPLRGPLVVELQARALRLAGGDVPGGYASQRLEWPPEALELSLEASAPARLWIRRDGPAEAHALAAGEHTLTLPAAARFELRAEPAQAGVFVLGVKALAVKP